MKDLIIIQRDGKYYQVTGEKNNLIYVQRLDDKFKPIPFVTGSYDKADFHKHELKNIGETYANT